MIEKVKLALRINHTLLDGEIAETIEEARAEMIRAGVSSLAVDEEDPLISSAIKTYCLAKLSSDQKMVDGYFKSWEHQIENIRKSGRYRLECSDV